MGPRDREECRDRERPERPHPTGRRAVRARRSTAPGAPRAGVALVAVGGLRPRGARAVQRPRRGARARPDASSGRLGGARSGTRCGTPARTSTTPCARSRRPPSRRRPTSRVALGLLDARHLAGDPNLTLRLRSGAAHALAPRRPGAAARAAQARDRRGGDLLGELAHASVPDLKESVGGLRDATVLKALVATWLVDVPHADLERSRGCAARRARRAARRGRPRHRPGGAGVLARPRRGARAAPTRPPRSGTPAALGRRITHLSRLTWRRVDAVLARPQRDAARGDRRWSRSRAGSRSRAARWCSTPGRDPADDPLPAAAGRRRGRRARTWCCRRPPPRGWCATCPPLPEPWPDEARDLFIRLLAAGPGLLAVWETLDETGARADGSCPSGSGSGCCRTRRWCTGSPSTGTWSRPASRRPR